MISACSINRKSGAAVSEGGGVFTMTARVGSIFELSIAFTDDLGVPGELPAGSSGRLLIKPTGSFTADDRFAVNSWVVSGVGNRRRYTFRGVLDSLNLRNDLKNRSSALFSCQIAYFVNGEPTITKSFDVIIENTQFQGDEAPPILPFGGPESVEFEEEVIPPTSPWVSGTYYVGHVNRGGNIFNVRLSLPTWHAGATVQLLLNGTTEVFTAPVVIAAETQAWTPGDAVNRLDITSVPPGARLDAVVTFETTLEYPVAPMGLRVSLSLRTQSGILDDSFAAMISWLVAGTGIGITANSTAKTFTFNNTSPAGAWDGISDKPDGLCLAEITEDGQWVLLKDLSGTTIAKLLRLQT